MKYTRRFLLSLALCAMAADAAQAASVLDVRESVSDKSIVYPESFETDVCRIYIHLLSYLYIQSNSLL